MAKLKKGGQSKSKVKKADCLISLEENNHEIIVSKIINDHSVQVIYGNMFSIIKREIELFEEQKNVGPKIIATISLGDTGDKQITQKKKGQNEEYQVTGVEDHQV